MGCAIAYLNLLALALLAERWTGSYLLSRLFTAPLLAAGFFWIEHFAGLGSHLGWAGLLAVLPSCAILFFRRSVLRRHWQAEMVFAAFFLYAFAWRYTFPNLDGTNSEKLTDLTFLLNYWDGTRLPPVDRWFPPYPFSMYYALQHYAAALLGRLHSLQPGVAYHFSFSVLAGLTGLAAWMTARLTARKQWHVWLALLVLAIGGTGASTVMHALKDNVQPADSMRFIGGSATPRLAEKPFGRWLTGVAHIPEENALELPIETFGYLLQLGDYHPPLGGYFLLFATLACMLLLEEAPGWFATAAIGASAPLIAAVNAWGAPLHAFLIGAWLLFRHWRKRPVEWRAFVSGGAFTTILLAPFFFHFVRSSSGAGMKFRFTPLDAHSPPLLILILLGPAIAILAAHWFHKNPPAIERAIVIFGSVAFLLTELIYVDDLYSGQYIRFNTTLKWWGPTYAAVLLIGGTSLLGASNRILQWIALAALLAPCLYVQDLWRFFVLTPKTSAGVLAGWGHLMDDPPNRPILEYLAAKPAAVALQRPAKPAYSSSPALLLFAGHTPFLGWQFHEQTWRGDLPAIRQRAAEVDSFYSGYMANAVNWLSANRIRYILWLREEHVLPPGSWERIEQQLSGTYQWREFWRMEEWRIGLWEQR